MPSTPIALSPALPYEFLTWILMQQTHPINLIICQPRAAFLTALQTSIPNTIPRQPPPPPEDAPSDPVPEPAETEPPPRHTLLIPTLHQVATSKHIKLAFIPTVSHLRAYLSVFPPESQGETSGQERKWDKPSKKKPLLVVYGLLGLHRDTSEWSAQGLGSSLAGVVEAGLRSGRELVLVEEKEVEIYDEDDDGEGRKEGAKRGWEERVPILNGSVRRTGLENVDGGWSGRTIEVGRVLARWFKFS